MQGIQIPQTSLEPRLNPSNFYSFPQSPFLFELLDQFLHFRNDSAISQTRSSRRFTPNKRTYFDDDGNPYEVTPSEETDDYGKSKALYSTQALPP